MNQDPESKQATCFIGCSDWDELWRHPQVYATTVSGGHTVATIVNWREHAWHDFEFRVQDLGVVVKPDQLIQVWDLWTHEMLGEYTEAEIETFGVQRIPGHGNFTFKFVVVDRPVPAEEQPEAKPFVEQE